MNRCRDASSRAFQIRIRGLEKTFGTHKVLRGVDLDVERGHINVVIGGSGQGKSVLMKHLMGLLKPDAGHIWVDGEDVVPMNDVQLNKLRRKFGMAFQYAALFDSLTVEQNVAFPLVEHTKKSKAEIHELVHEAARRRSGCATSRRSSPPSSRAACASAWAWRARSSWSRRFCCTMSRRRASIRSRPRTSTT